MCGLSGNAAITLRSRLKVKVVKDMLQRTGQQPQSRELQQQLEHNGLLPHGHTNSEAGKVTLQLQVGSLLSVWTGVGVVWVTRTHRTVYEHRFI